MRGRYIRSVWQPNPGLYAPATYRRACGYEAFIPDPLDNLNLALPGDTAGVLSEAEHAVAELNRAAGPELAPLARLMLRTESIASSKVEGMQLDARSLARAETSQETGHRIGPQAADILANIDAMELAVEQASRAGQIRPENLLEVIVSP